MEQQYELLVILPNRYTDSELPEVITTFEGLLKKHGAEGTKHEYMGKRKLAYPIEEHTQGNYVMFTYVMPTEKVAIINRELELNPEVVRHFITIHTPLTSAELERDVRRRAQLERQDERRRASESEEQRPRTNARSSTPTSPSKRPEELVGGKIDTAEKVDLEQLDAKLDAMLAEDDASIKEAQQ